MTLAEPPILERVQTVGQLRLSKLSVSGFKSFADATDFTFDRPVTGIVGPNGCGKSNVVDAVKWVLGEQSAKTLRGGSMQDVIFNGSDARPAANSAEVTLTFDNPRPADGERPLAIDLDTVSVSRVLLRDGTSHYKIAGRRSRLKDVRDLLVDTGVGGGSYCVIEQGRVARMLEADPAERRLLFEEAAGVGRFRGQRREADRRLERTMENLRRLDDVTAEVERQLRATRQAAGRARTYAELTERVADVRLRLARHRYRMFAASSEAAEAKRREATEALEQAEAHARHVAAEAEAATAQAEAAESRRRDIEMEQLRRHTELSRAKDAAELAKERHADAVVRLDAAAAERDRLAEELAALPTDDTVPGEDEARLAVEAAERKRADAAAVVSEKRQASDVVRKRLSEQSAAQAAASTRLMRAERDADAAAVRLSSIEDQLQQVEQAARVTEAAVADLGEQADDDVEKLRAEATQARERSDEAARRLAEIEAGVADARREVNELRERRAALGAHRDALAKDVAAEAEAGSGLATTRQHVDIVGTVSSLLDVPVEWSTAVEAALADRLTDVVVQTRPMDLTWTTDLKEAVRLLPRTSCSSSRGWTTQCSEGATAAVAVVRSSTEGLVDALLCDVLLVDELPREASATHSLATRDGRVLWPDGTLRVGPTLRTTLSRRAELDGVEADVRANQAQLDDATRRLEAAREQQDEAATLLANAGATATEAATHLRDAERDADTRQRERDRVVSEAANTKQRLERLRHERDELADGQAIARATVAESTREQAAADEVVDALSRKVADADRQLSEASTAASDGRLQHARAEAHLHALLTAAEQSRERRLTTAARADAAAQAVMELGGLVDRLDNEVAQADQALAATEARADASGDLQEATQQAADAKQQRLAAHERHQSADRDVATKRAELSEVERDATAASIRLETHVMRCRDEMQLNIPDLQTQGDDLLVDEKASEAELADLQGRLSRLGGVNPKAAEELEALEERREEIEREARDVRTAVADLRRMIEELDHERDERFTATFEKVREEFNGLFRRLFGGGKAELSLREIEDSAEPPGVEVVARPPGKKPVTMSQLSGGEKSMISVALLMSLFRSRPGPFCMLDEVDAALDEANTKRFCSLLDDFIGETQFIIVTHSKPTMKAADVLYGVTMPQPGVSRRVEVRFDQVGANSEIAVVN